MYDVPMDRSLYKVCTISLIMAKAVSMKYMFRFKQGNSKWKRILTQPMC
jgi:hypothetical protein